MDSTAQRFTASECTSTVAASVESVTAITSAMKSTCASMPGGKFEKTPKGPSTVKKFGNFGVAIPRYD